MTRLNTTLGFLIVPCLIATSARLPAQVSKQSESPQPKIAQLYFYSIKERPSFEEGYRRHLAWHSSKNDQLVWYAWSIDSGARAGTFVDGTFGATFADLDARPDLAGDGADWKRNVAPYVTPLDIETAELWPGPSTVTPLEDRRPGSVLDVFLFHVEPAGVPNFEGAIETLAKNKRVSSKLSWYRAVRGKDSPAYMLVLTRQNWADLRQAGASVTDLLANAYSATSAQVSEALKQVRAVSVETWSYEPRLSLIPGRPLEPYNCRLREHQSPKRFIACTS